MRKIITIAISVGVVVIHKDSRWQYLQTASLPEHIRQLPSSLLLSFLLLPSLIIETQRATTYGDRKCVLVYFMRLPCSPSARGSQIQSTWTHNSMAVISSVKNTGRIVQYWGSEGEIPRRGMSDIGRIRLCETKTN